MQENVSAPTFSETDINGIRLNVKAFAVTCALTSSRLEIVQDFDEIGGSRIKPSRPQFGASLTTEATVSGPWARD